MTSSIKRELDQFGKRFQIALSRFLVSRIKHSSVRDKDALRISRAAADFALRPGKRLRPFLVYKAAYTHNASPKNAMILAIAMELFHDFALVHDDIMDQSDERRGLPTVHRQFRQLHKTLHWKGESDHFGDSAAILTGDLLAVWAEQAVASLDVRSAIEKNVQYAWNTLREEVILGQMMDVTTAYVQAIPSITHIKKILALKSGRYSIGRPILLGLSLSGTRYSEQSILRATEPLGIAFQMQDDLISTFGSHEQTGKDADTDIKEGKITLLAVDTINRLNPRERAVWRKSFGNPRATKKEVQTIRSLIRSYGAPKRALTEINKLTAQSIVLADHVPELKTWFIRLAELLLSRTN